MGVARGTYFYGNLNCKSVVGSAELIGSVGWVRVCTYGILRILVVPLNAGQFAGMQITYSADILPEASVLHLV